MTGSAIARLLATVESKIDDERLVGSALQLVRIRSWPGEEADVASAYADLLTRAGAEVTFDTSFSGSPTVLARVGSSGRTTLQFAGHLDTVPVPHNEPSVEHGTLYGRGACDMKGAMAALVETIRLVAPIIDQLDGNILVTAYGLHEGAGAGPMHAPLRRLLATGSHGDSAIVCEGPRLVIPTCGKGSLIFHIEFLRHEEGPDHELMGNTKANPLMAAQRFISLAQAHVEASEFRHASLGGETFFVGAVHGGDLYNRIPLSATIDGTRRYPPPRQWSDVTAELGRIQKVVEAEFDVRIEPTYEKSGQPFELAQDLPVIEAVRQAHQEVTGSPLPLGCQLFSSDINHFVAEAGIPTAAYGVNPHRAHATPEYVSVDELLMTVRVFVRSAIRLLTTRHG